MGPHLVFAHGFTQTASSWTAVRRLLADRGLDDTVAVDLPGHGESHASTGDLWHSADELVGHGGVGTYVGYSMGGRVVLHAALAHPAAVERMVLIGATAGIDDDAERAARRTSDETLAARIEEVGVERFVDEWLQNPLFAGLDASSAQRADRLRNTAEGLASSLRTVGTGFQQPLWDRLPDVQIPALVLVGAADAKFTAIGERLCERLPDATLCVVDGAGHSVHLEQPAATVDALCDWLART